MCARKREHGRSVCLLGKSVGLFCADLFRYDVGVWWRVDAVHDKISLVAARDAVMMKEIM